MKGLYRGFLFKKILYDCFGGSRIIIIIFFLNFCFLNLYFISLYIIFILLLSFLEGFIKFILNILFCLELK